MKMQVEIRFDPLKLTSKKTMKKQHISKEAVPKPAN
jgi:hypothetical protein